MAVVHVAPSMLGPGLWAVSCVCIYMVQNRDWNNGSPLITILEESMVWMPMIYIVHSFLHSELCMFSMVLQLNFTVVTPLWCLSFVCTGFFGDVESIMKFEPKLMLSSLLENDFLLNKTTWDWKHHRTNAVQKSFVIGYRNKCLATQLNAVAAKTCSAHVR